MVAWFVQKLEEDKVKAAEEREAMLRSNPLVNLHLQQQDATQGGVKRSWDDDVVFKNQAKLTASQKAEHRKKR